MFKKSKWDDIMSLGDMSLRRNVETGDLTIVASDPWHEGEITPEIAKELMIHLNMYLLGRG